MSVKKKTARDQLYDIVVREFIGPDPIPGCTQENGEEIITSDAPLIRYIAGVLYPKHTSSEDVDKTEKETVTEKLSSDNNEKIENIPANEKDLDNSSGEFLSDAEELISLSNAYRPSALSITVSIKSRSDISVLINAGRYIKEKDESNYPIYFRYPINIRIDPKDIDMPDETKRIVTIPLVKENGESIFSFCITYRYFIPDSNSTVYTFTLINDQKEESIGNIDEACFFQASFSLQSVTGFQPLPQNIDLETTDEDVLSNQMLYSKRKNYAVGHGCAADWKENEHGVVTEIASAIFPTYEMKPIVPASIEGVSLDMYRLGQLDETIITELDELCDKYETWIDHLELISNEDSSYAFYQTQQRHINNCRNCCSRMRKGAALLRNDKRIFRAFQLMNQAMLMQQLHYNLPLQNWVIKNDDIFLEKKYERMPEIHDSSTWFGDHSRYGKWRPFQLAFILMNLESMSDKVCADRNIVDLIWFPTGGGKTEAYLGLTAFTIFYRKLTNSDDYGTTVIMRYTLRLLTTQQFERAASLICSCEKIRMENQGELGNNKITAGLWVGKGTSPNSISDAIKDYNSLLNGSSDIYPFIILKCPWCGAEIGKIQLGHNQNRIVGIKKETLKRGKTTISFRCSNPDCCYSDPSSPLPLTVIDEDIYKSPPTLLIGTVDKFAMLPYRPEAQRIFGIENGKKKNPPDLIIQDELHLISGPLGSMVGLYEIMVNELSSITTPEGKTINPKVIASTATISHAKEQCNSLYCCGNDKVSQFPPAGIEQRDSFFAIEDSSGIGRKYVGIFTPSASSPDITRIHLFSALLYGAAALQVDSEKERDPYWTNLSYFNSLRELGRTATTISSDIVEYLHTIYLRRKEYEKEDYRQTRRYIYRSEELTSRIRSDKIPSILQALQIPYIGRDKENNPIDICLATNMVSVGVDVPRLGLMTVIGQPKTTSEYIQATSRIGRSANAPGIIFVVYNPGRPRDKSHYEHFISYHSKIYSQVEPTSVTPFSSPSRARALHAIIFGISRLLQPSTNYNNPQIRPSQEEARRLRSIIQNRVSNIDKDELTDTQKKIDEIFERWKSEGAQRYDTFSSGDTLPLMYPWGTIPEKDWDLRGFPTPTSMRSVDAPCDVRIIPAYRTGDE